MNCKKCGSHLFELPEDVNKGKGWRCMNDKCDLYQVEQYDLNEIESEDEDN